MFIYLSKNITGVHELEYELVYFEFGDTYEDYLDGKFILLSEEQNDFRLSNPDASAKEIIAMELDPIILPPEPPEIPDPGKYTQK